MNGYEARYKALIQRIAHSCERAQRNPADVRWMAVTKTRSVEDIRSVYDLGVRDVGENYAQEAFHKMGLLQDLNLTWHFIGHIQSNKALAIAERFDWVHSADRIKTLERLDRGAAQSRKVLNVCIQVNLDGESQKSGVAVEDLPGIVAYLKGCCHLSFRGLMFIPQPRDTPDDMKMVFNLAFKVFSDWRARACTVDTLSMGMSSDLHVAVECGATFLRVGTDLFGPRR